MTCWSPTRATGPSASCPPSGTFFGVQLAADALGTVAGEGSYGPYLIDGLSALGQTGEVNFPSGLALGPGGGFYVADGAMRVIRFVADGSTTLFGSQVGAGNTVTVAGVLAERDARQPGDWVRTHMSSPAGLRSPRPATSSTRTPARTWWGDQRSGRLTCGLTGGRRSAAPSHEVVGPAPTVRTATPSAEAVLTPCGVCDGHPALGHFGERGAR